MPIGEVEKLAWLDAFIEREALPYSFRKEAIEYYLPLADQVKIWSESVQGAYFLGLNGGQGTGKSTVAALLALTLRKRHGLSTAVVSLDDLYLPKAAREELAARVHPLLQTRGVPGTHDIELALALFENVAQGQAVEFPVFDKAIDDRSSKLSNLVGESTDIFLFEGWCVAACAEDSVCEPVNDFEAQYDSDGLWRQYANTQLAGHYQTLFSYLNHLVMLKAPSFECIYAWRGLQEQKLALRVQQEGADSSGVMSEEELIHFISHYERLTRHMLEEMPLRAGVVIELAEDHSVSGVKGVL